MDAASLFKFNMQSKGLKIPSSPMKAFGIEWLEWKSEALVLD